MSEFMADYVIRIAALKLEFHVVKSLATSSLQNLYGCLVCQHLVEALPDTVYYLLEPFVLLCM